MFLIHSAYFPRCRTSPLKQKRRKGESRGCRYCAFEKMTGRMRDSLCRLICKPCRQA